MASVSLTMIVRNESRYLRECLQSAKQAVDEIIVVDTGSTDDTKDIASEFGAKIYDFPWCDDFSAARNHAISKAGGDWLLYLDADERLDPESVAELRRLTGEKRKAGINCIVKSVDSKGGRPSIMKYVRLFSSHPGIAFLGRAHEQISSSLLQQGFSLEDSSILIHHLGYDIDDKAKRKKANRNLPLLLKDYEEFETPYTAFQLGMTYGVLDDKKTAVVWFGKAIGGKEKLTPAQEALSLRFIAAAALESGDLALAEQAIDKAYQSDAGQPLVNLIGAKIKFAAARNDIAVQLGKQAVAVNRQLLTGQRVASFDIMVREEELLYYGIDLALHYTNRELFNYYFAELKTIGAISSELPVVDRILNNDDISPQDTETLKHAVSESSLPLYLTLLKNYNRPEKRAEIINGFRAKLGDTLALLQAEAGALTDSGKYREAASLLRRAIQAKPEDPVAYFLMISTLVQSNNLSEAIDLADAALRLFSGNPAIKKNLVSTIEKLKSFTNARH